MSIWVVLSFLTVLIWLVLACARGGFWRADLPSDAPAPAQWPDVVAVIPARDEADVIGLTITQLLQQDYPGALHVVLVDDHSSDGTADCARKAAQQLNRLDMLTVIAARPLPTGWTGKVWAQSEGLAAVDAQFPNARYAWLTDADIGHNPSALRQLVARAEHEGLDLTSLMVRLRCQSLAEKALIPAFVFFFAKLYPFSQVNTPGHRTAAAAGGCMLARRTALARIGGIAAIRNALIDDCALGTKIKQGGSIRLDLAKDSLSLRRYDSWRSIWDMIARTAYTQLHYSPLLLAGTVLGMCLTYLAPPLLILSGGPAVWPAALAWLIMAGIYLPMLRYYHRSPIWAPFLPLIALFYLGATLDSARRYWLGKGGQWKGRAQASH